MVSEINKTENKGQLVFKATVEGVHVNCVIVSV